MVSGLSFVVLRTFAGRLFFAFWPDPHRDPYEEMSGEVQTAAERILPMVFAASFCAEVVTWV